MHLVVGLGNPGAQYVATRHNVGFLAADAIARRAMVSIDREQHGALTTKARLGSTPLVLAKPQRFMNLSGGPTRALVDFYKADPASELVVIHDELELPFGEIRVKQGGGHGGHNGLRDLNKHVGNGYVRVRVGIGRPPAGWDVANYVLGRWSDEEHARLEEVVATAADAAESAVLEGPAAASRRFAGAA